MLFSNNKNVEAEKRLKSKGEKEISENKNNNFNNEIINGYKKIIKEKEEEIKKMRDNISILKEHLNQQKEMKIMKMNKKMKKIFITLKENQREIAVFKI